MSALLKQEDERQYEAMEADYERFKAQIFAVSPPTYDSMFGSRREDAERMAREAEAEVMVPESRDELRDVAKALGLAVPE